MKWSGDFDIESIEKRLKAACENAAEEIADEVLARSQKAVPTDRLELKRSGTTSEQHTATTAEAAISYGTDHAIIQHEYMDYTHDDGSAKFLERPLGEAEDDARKILERHVGQVLE